MSSTIMDFFVDKIISFSSKMKEDSSKFSGPSYLMSANNSSLSQQLSPVDLFNGLLGDAITNGETSNRIVPFKQHLGFPVSNYSFSFRNAKKPLLHSLNSLVVMDLYRHSHSSLEYRFLSNDSMVSHLVNGFCNNFSEMNRNKFGIEINKPSPSLVTEANKPVGENHSPAKKRCELSNKCTVPNTLTLNKELANRKTKEMLKRSKKRRRRQKKTQKMNNNCTSISDDDVDSSITSSLTRVCMVSDNAELGCTVALSHSLTVAPKVLSSFVVSVKSSSDDDSEWETYGTEEVDSSCQINQDIDTDIIVSNIPTSKSSVLECSQLVNCDNQKATFLSSFMVPVEGSTDDESDWDSCSTTEIFPDMPEFEFTGLFLTSLCTSPTQLVDSNCSFNNTTEDDETIKLRIHLKEVNRKWNESAEGLEEKPKLPSKVSFAPNDILAEVFPVEMYERKGEWEIYATERLRFKRRIDELEKILSPCLHPDHRSKVFKKITEAVL